MRATGSAQQTDARAMDCTAWSVIDAAVSDVVAGSLGECLLISCQRPGFDAVMLSCRARQFNTIAGARDVFMG